MSGEIPTIDGQHYYAKGRSGVWTIYRRTDGRAIYPVLTSESAQSQLDHLDETANHFIEVGRREAAGERKRIRAELLAEIEQFAYDGDGDFRIVGNRHDGWEVWRQEEHVMRIVGEGETLAEALAAVKGLVSAP